MIRKVNFIVCEEDHGATSDSVFPNPTSIDVFNLENFADLTIGAVRRAAKKEGWGRLHGGDYCPYCCERMKS